MKVPSWKNTDFIESPFVEITSGSGIDVAMQYPMLGMRHGENRCFVRLEALCTAGRALSRIRSIDSGESRSYKCLL